MNKFSLKYSKIDKMSHQQVINEACVLSKENRLKEAN